METNPKSIVPKRFLFSCAGGYGHFHPLVPLARALQQRGHEVAFAVGASLQAMVEAAGFKVFCFSSSLQQDPQYGPFRAKLAKMPPGLESELFIYTNLFCGINTRVRTPNLMEIARNWQPDMLIREAGEYAAVIVSECLGIPHVVVSFAAALKTLLFFEQEAASQLDPIRQAWGLAPDPLLTSLYSYLYLNYSPPEFSLGDIGMPVAGASIPATTHFIRPDFFDNSRDQTLPDWIAQLPAQPTVYVTMGTEVNNTPEFYPSVLQTIIAGLRDSQLNLIVTLGRDKDPAVFGPQPSNVHIEPYIPQSLLLNHCDLMVFHGGSNTVLAGLDIGLPMVVVPLIADQFFNAEITHRLGLGKAVPWERLNPTTIRTVVEEVLGNGAYRQNLKRLQAEMHSLPDQGYAVQLVEKVVVEQQAVLNPALINHPMNR